MTVADVEQFLFDADTDTLDRISEVVKIRRTHIADRMAQNLRVGDKVSFEGRTRGKWAGRLVGEITKINRKKAKVGVTDPIYGHTVTWTVPFTMLTQED
ncbi:MAG: hypothetical protein VW443_04805 [Pseudomonadales bacterium]|jgi:hypothetical protein